MNLIYPRRREKRGITTRQVPLIMNQTQKDFDIELIGQRKKSDSTRFCHEINAL
jgi:hypothetical protein